MKIDIVGLTEEEVKLIMQGCRRLWVMDGNERANDIAMKILLELDKLRVRATTEERPTSS